MLDSVLNFFTQISSRFTDLVVSFIQFIKLSFSFSVTFSNMLFNIPVVGPIFNMLFYVFIIAFVANLFVYLWKFFTGGVK